MQHRDALGFQDALGVRSMDQKAGAAIGSQIFRMLGKAADEEHRPMPFIQYERQDGGERVAWHLHRLSRKTAGRGVMEEMDDGVEIEVHGAF